MATETVFVAEYLVEGGHRWKELTANGAPLLYYDQETKDHELQKVVNSQNAVSMGRCQFRWKKVKIKRD